MIRNHDLDDLDRFEPMPRMKEGRASSPNSGKVKRATKGLYMPKFKKRGRGRKS